MSHVYASYIESKADEYYARQVHESLCETQLPNTVPRGSHGQTYDVYVIRHCNCWLSDNWEDLTLARKFEALRDLSRRYGLHSGACSRLKKTPIIYRNRPETLRYGCDCWLSVDMRPDSPIEYKQQPDQQEKEQTMGDLSKAVKLAETFEQSKRDVNNLLAPFAEDYAAFLIEDSKGYNRLQNFKLDTFEEIEGENFYLKGEEVYAYSEYDTPYLTLPFAFVENTQQYKNDFRAKQAEAKAKADAKKAKDKAERVERLKIQLAKAQAELDKALSAGTDDIKITATANQVASLSEKG